MLLDAGAAVNAKDGRGMTPLMFAVAKSRQQPAVIRMLIDRGADLGAQSNAGETAADWARKVGAAAGLEILKVARAQDAPAAVPPDALGRREDRSGAQRRPARILQPQVFREQRLRVVPSPEHHRHGGRRGARARAW